MHYRKVQHNILQKSTGKYSMVHYSYNHAVEYIIAQYSTLYNSTMQNNTVKYSILVLVHGLCGQP